MGGRVRKLAKNINKKPFNLNKSWEKKTKKSLTKLWIKKL